MEMKNTNRVGPTCKWRWLACIRIAHDVVDAGRWDRHARASGRERMGYDAELGQRARLEREKELGHGKEFKPLNFLIF